MSNSTGKPSYNRSSREKIEGECGSRNHTLLEFDYPIIKVRCHCGHEYEQKLSSYRAAKNSCKKCDSRRKSKPRPEHALMMTGERNPSKRPEVRQKISDKTKGPRPHLVGIKKKWKPGVLQARAVWLSNMRKSGSITSPGNLGSTWVPTPEQRLLPGTLYLIRYLDEDGTHFKIGITKLTLAKRFRRGQLVSILHLHNSTLGECFDLEQSLLKWAKDNGHRYSSHSTTELLRADAIPYVLATLRQ